MSAPEPMELEDRGNGVFYAPTAGIYRFPTTQPAPACTDCRRCVGETAIATATATGNWWQALPVRMVVCPGCGNKRCPRASWHGNTCTGSNEPGQPGADAHLTAAGLPENQDWPPT